MFGMEASCQVMRQRRKSSKHRMLSNKQWILSPGICGNRSWSWRDGCIGFCFEVNGWNLSEYFNLEWNESEPCTKTISHRFFIDSIDYSKQRSSTMILGSFKNYSSPEPTSLELSWLQQYGQRAKIRRQLQRCWSSTSQVLQPEYQKS